MGLFRLLLFGFLIYFGYKLIKEAIQGYREEPKIQVKGKPKKKPLDLDDSQIEDADYEEVKDS
jgi:uncharacterized membrane protein